MALTRNAKRTGRAASTELAEQREWIREQQEARRQEFTSNFGEAMDKLRALDPTGWSNWYDEQAEQTAGKMYPVILARVAELEDRNSLITAARTIREEMSKVLSVHPIQEGKAEVCLRASLQESKRAKTDTRWKKVLLANAAYWMDEARKYLGGIYAYRPGKE